MYLFLLWLVMIVYCILGCLCIKLLIKFLEFPSRERGGVWKMGSSRGLKKLFIIFSLTLHSIKISNFLWAIPHQLWPFFRGDKAPSPFDVQIVSNLFNNSVWPWVIAGNQDYWAYILSILADWWNSPTSYLAKRVYFCSKCHASFRDSRILLQSFWN